MRITKRYVVLMAMLIAMLVLSACSAAEAPAPVSPAGEPTATTAAAAEPTAPPPTAEAADLGVLAANPWQWVSFTDPLQQFDVEMPESYLLTFNEDGTVNIKADCKNAMGSYTDEDGALTIEAGPATLALCPGDSRGEQFVTLLGGAARYFFQDGQLFIDLMADGGTMAFAPASGVAMPDDGANRSNGWWVSTTEQGWNRS